MADMREPVHQREVGRDLTRIDAGDKTHGRARYPQDLPLPEGCLHLATVRVPTVGARIGEVDTSPALRVPGVVRVLTAEDVGGTNRFGLLESDQPVLAEDRIRGASDVVALVIAESDRAARNAARRVRTDLTPLPLLLDPEDSCKPDAPVIHPARRMKGRHPNVVAEREIELGQVDGAFEEAHVVISGEYRTPMVEPAFMAPESAVAYRDDAGRLTLHVATQWPEADLRQAAAALGEPIESLRIVQGCIGGAFGGREDISLQILALLAARETGRPVRIVWDRAESIRGHGKRHPFRIRHRLGADADGRLTAVEIDVLADAGCYASTSAGVLDNALSQACGPYAIANAKISGRAVYTNNPFTCAQRGFGVNQMAFAMEQQLNKLAAKLSIGQAEIRRRNFVSNDGRLASGAVVTDVSGLPRTLDHAVGEARRNELPTATDRWRYGRGLACALKNVGYSFGFEDRATASVTLGENDAVVRIGAADVGQGVATVITQIAAESLCLSPEAVALRCADTADVPEAGSSSASRLTYMAGNAVRGACAAAREAREADPTAAVTRTYTFMAPPTRPIGRPGAAHAYAYSWAASVADVRVDVDTGRVEVIRVTTALDPGRVINPRMLEGQVEGGAVMAQGYALHERCVLEEGMPVSLDLAGCSIATAVDAPRSIATIVVESPEARGPFGARGIGEITMIPVVPAIISAIYDATGAWIDEIPALPERVLASLHRR